MIKHFKQQSRLWDYTISRKLGKGTSGEVFKVVNKNTNQVFALKKMSIADTQEKQKIQAFKQIKCLSLLSHPSIIQYKESFLSMDNIYIVMEYAAKGDLLHAVEERKRKQKFYLEDQLWKLFEEIIRGLKYLHEKCIIHRDLKLENIFITQNGKVKIGDLGMAKILTKEDQLISTRVGTPIYFAPQMIQNQLYSFPIDVWSLGCVFYYLTTLQHPFQEASIQTLAYYAIDKGPKPIKGQYSLEIINFILSCLEQDVNKRPTVFQLALKIKKRDQPQSQRYNRMSIFNLNHLNRILTASAQPQSCGKGERKNKFERQFSHRIASPRKNKTSFEGRKKIQSERKLFQTRDIKSSAENRNSMRIESLIQSPQSPVVSKIFNSQSAQRVYFPNKILEYGLELNCNSPCIKSSGFSLQVINRNKLPDNFFGGQMTEPQVQKSLLLRKAFARKSYR